MSFIAAPSTTMSPTTMPSATMPSTTMPSTAASSTASPAGPPVTSAAVSPRLAARIAAFGYLAIFVLAIFANFAVVERLIVPDDDAATFARFAADESLLRVAIAAFVAIFALDVVIAWALHQLLRPFGEAVSALAAWFRIVYTVFMGVAVVFLFAVLELVDGAGGTFADDQRAGLAAMALSAFDFAWMVGLVTFGLHLVTVGLMMVRAEGLPTLLGVGLAAAGVAYVLDTGATVLDPAYASHTDVYETIVIVASIVAEFGFMVWLFHRVRTAPVPAAPMAAELA